MGVTPDAPVAGQHVRAMLGSGVGVGVGGVAGRCGRGQGPQCQCRGAVWRGWGPRPHAPPRPSPRVGTSTPTPGCRLMGPAGGLPGSSGAGAGHLTSRRPNHHNTPSQGITHSHLLSSPHLTPHHTCPLSHSLTVHHTNIFPVCLFVHNICPCVHTNLFYFVLSLYNILHIL